MLSWISGFALVFAHFKLQCECGPGADGLGTADLLAQGVRETRSMEKKFRIQILSAPWDGQTREVWAECSRPEWSIGGLTVSIDCYEDLLK